MSFVLGRMWLGVVWGGVLCENCIVDANAIKKATMNSVCCCLFFLFCGFVLGIFCCLCVKNSVFFVFRAHGGCLGMLSR